MFEFEQPPIPRTRDVEPVPLTDGTALDLHQARKDLARYVAVTTSQPFEELHHREKEVAPLTPAQKIGQNTLRVVGLRTDYELAA